MQRAIKAARERTTAMEAVAEALSSLSKEDAVGVLRELLGDSADLVAAPSTPKVTRRRKRVKRRGGPQGFIGEKTKALIAHVKEHPKASGADRAQAVYGSAESKDVNRVHSLIGALRKRNVLRRTKAGLFVRK